jgi:hypothetical protein
MPLDCCGDIYMKQMCASVIIDLPAEEFAEAEAKLKVKPIWEAFLKSLSDAGIDHEAKRETLETRAKPVRTGAKPGRKPRQPIAFPQQPIATFNDDPPEAA